MPEEREFRCPFEVQGIERGAILDVALNEDRALRLASMRTALVRLKHDRTIHSVRFVLPESILVGCDSLEALRERILPFQAEFLAADIDCLLYPHLPYHSVWQRFKAHFRPSRRHYRYAARALEVALYTGEYGMPTSLNELADMIEALFLDQIENGDPDPMFIFGSLRKNGGKFWLFKMERGAFAIYHDQDALLDPAVNDAHFSIVKAPLYPRAFGRYSERCEIVVTRDVDVAALPFTSKMRIRREANEVHRAHGVRLADMFSQQPTGLWIPEQYNRPP
jgi:hypothetical protein